MLQPTLGTAYIGGSDIRTSMAAIRESLGICPQFDILWPDITVAEHLQLYAVIKGATYAQASTQARQAAAEVRAQLGTLHSLRQLAHMHAAVWLAGQAYSGAVSDPLVPFVVVVQLCTPLLSAVVAAAPVAAAGWLVRQDGLPCGGAVWWSAPQAVSCHRLSRPACSGVPGRANVRHGPLQQAQHLGRHTPQVGRCLRHTGGCQWEARAAARELLSGIGLWVAE